MPDAPLRFCATPFCPNKVSAGHCPDHRHAKAIESRFGEDARYGTQRWRRYSRQRLVEHPFCAKCECLLVGRDGVTDHILPVKDRPDLFWEESNHQSLCQSCNRVKDDPRASDYRRPQTRTVERHVICGPPGAGKTTWVAQRAQPGDVVWDLDAVATVVAQMPTFPRPPIVLDALMAMRSALVDWLVQHRDVSAYLIVADPVDAQRVAVRIGGRLVPLDARH